MSKTQRQEPKPKQPPRQLKRQRRQEAMQPQPLDFPTRQEVVTFKPMG